MKRTCELCSDLSEIYQFNSPDDYINAINTLKSKVNSNTFTIVEPDEDFQGDMTELLELPDSPPYPDIMFYKYKCTYCLITYNIFLDWYHGKGEILRNN